LIVRDATLADAPAIAALVSELGYEITADDAERRLRDLETSRERPIVAEQEDTVIGCLTWHVTAMLHRSGRVGRVTMLVVREAARGRGVGRALMNAAEQRLLERGCARIEVTSNMRRSDAHAFYSKLGFGRTSYLFAKPTGG
jgi:N-acetylglutamate synthase-like GNAT family acetyltransferase